MPLQVYERVNAVEKALATYNRQAGGGKYLECSVQSHVLGVEDVHTTHKHQQQMRCTSGVVDHSIIKVHHKGEQAGNAKKAAYLPQLLLRLLRLLFRECLQARGSCIRLLHRAIQCQLQTPCLCTRLLHRALCTCQTRSGRAVVLAAPLHQQLFRECLQAMGSCIRLLHRAIQCQLQTPCLCPRPFRRAFQRQQGHKAPLLPLMAGLL